MGAFYDSIPPNLLEWIAKQHLFWVASAPLDANGHINVSPKGTFDCFHIINPNKVWYEDLTGSGVETISHMRENGRITIMFTAFEGPPRIVRLFGKGTVHEFGTPEYEELIPEKTRNPGSRAAIVIDVYKVGSSCGYSVPYYDFKGNRTLLMEHANKKEVFDRSFELPRANGASDSKGTGPSGEKSDSDKARSDKGIRSYWLENNMKSLDGLPGISSAPYAKPVPQSSWRLQGEPEEGKGYKSHKTVVKGSVLGQDAKLMVAFSLGVLVAAATFKLSDHLGA